MRLAPVPDWLLLQCADRRIRVRSRGAHTQRNTTPAGRDTRYICHSCRRNAGAVTPIASLPFYVVAGALLGLLGAAYNATIVGFLDLFQWVQRLPAVVPAAMVGLVVGLLARFAPSFVGGR